MLLAERVADSKEEEQVQAKLPLYPHRRGRGWELPGPVTMLELSSPPRTRGLPFPPVTSHSFLSPWGLTWQLVLVLAML